MVERFCVTSIESVLFVPKEMYREKTTAFAGRLRNNEIIFKLSGECIVRLGNETVRENAGDIRYMNAGEYSVYNVERITDGDCIDVLFRSDAPLESGLKVHHPADYAKCATLFKKIYSLWARKDEGYYAECMALLYEILVIFGTNKYSPKSKKEKLAPAREYIVKHFNEKLNCTELAAMCNVSYTYFKRLFEEAYGVSPKQYIVNLRLTTATEMLQSSAFSVTQTAERCGYEYVGFFSRQFKNVYGVSPREYKKALR